MQHHFSVHCFNDMNFLCQLLHGNYLDIRFRKYLKTPLQKRKKNVYLLRKYSFFKEKKLQYNSTQQKRIETRQTNVTEYKNQQTL